MKELATHGKWLTSFLKNLDENILHQQAMGYQIKGISLSTGLHKKISEGFGYYVVDLLGYVLYVDDGMVDEETNVAMELGFITAPLQ